MYVETVVFRFERDARCGVCHGGCWVCAEGEEEVGCDDGCDAV